MISLASLCLRDLSFLVLYRRTQSLCASSWQAEIMLNWICPQSKQITQNNNNKNFNTSTDISRTVTEMVCGGQKSAGMSLPPEFQTQEAHTRHCSIQFTSPHPTQGLGELDRGNNNFLSFKACLALSFSLGGNFWLAYVSLSLGLCKKKKKLQTLCFHDTKINPCF